MTFPFKNDFATEKIDVSSHIPRLHPYFRYGVSIGIRPVRTVIIRRRRQRLTDQLFDLLESHGYAVAAVVMKKVSEKSVLSFHSYVINFVFLSGSFLSGNALFEQCLQLLQSFFKCLNLQREFFNGNSHSFLR